MRHLDLFSGIGGFALAASWVWGNKYEPVCFVEYDPESKKPDGEQFNQLVLKKNFPGIPIYGDIRNFDATKYRGTIDLVTGGFPCQPFSVAGKRKGADDDRALWPEMLRIISEARPRYIIAENVTGLLSMVEPNSLSQVEVSQGELFQSLDSIAINKIIQKIHRRIITSIIQDLEKIGYDFPRLADGTPVILCVPACAVDAPHRRDRVWILGYAKHTGRNAQKIGESLEARKRGFKAGEKKTGEFEGSGILADATGSGCKTCRSDRMGEESTGQAREIIARGSGIVADAIGAGLEKRKGIPGNITKEFPTIKRNGNVANPDPFNDNGERFQSGETPQQPEAEICGGWQWLPEPELGRVVDGIPNRVDRLRGLGNAIVPQVAVMLMQAIKTSDEQY